MNFTYFRMKETQANKQAELKSSKHSSSKEHKRYGLKFAVDFMQQSGIKDSAVSQTMISYVIYVLSLLW